ncbi:MAG: class I SAM-dependent RNA methyltransferase [Oscillospiraceae bacterium]|nr:class I SAM-dependent RNA methyltransferase [Oscillospiraceae bacterium]
MENMTFCVPCLFGLEGLVAEELRRLHMGSVRAQDRRVFFDGGYADMARANLCLRMGERVMILLASFEARSFEELYQGVLRIPLEEFVPKNGAFPVKGYSLDSQLHSVPDCQSIAKKAAVDRLGRHYGLSWLPETGEIYQLHFAIMKDLCEVFLDTSGAGLHKRGYRAQANLAPLHETMAAAMVELARYRGRDFFWDPFCGSGTLCIEAAMMALNRAPGMGRSFAAQQWSCVDGAVWQQARVEALDREFRGNYRILGTDIDGESLDIARCNAKKAGVEQWIEFREGDATKMDVPAPTGVIVTNPPYGERMLEQKSAQQLYRSFGRHIRYQDGWKLYLISSEPEFESCFGRKADKKRKLYNGRLPCNVYMYFEKKRDGAQGDYKK